MAKAAWRKQWRQAAGGIDISSARAQHQRNGIGNRQRMATAYGMAKA